MAARKQSVGTGVVGVLILAQLLTAQALHTPQEPSVVEWDVAGSGEVLNWSYARAPFLLKDFMEAHAMYFSGVNWSIASNVHTAADYYANWSSSKLSNLSYDLRMNQSILNIFRNFTALSIPNYTALTCNGSPSSSNDLLLDTKLTLLYTQQNLIDGSLSYLNGTTAGALSPDFKKALVFAFDCLSDMITQWNFAFGGLNYTEIWTVLNNTDLATNITKRLHYNATASEVQWLNGYLGLVGRINQYSIANVSSLLIDLGIRISAADFQCGTLASQPLNAPAPLDKHGFIGIGNEGATTYTRFHFLSIDCGGNDTYNNNAGGANAIESTPGKSYCVVNLAECGIGVAIDLGTGSDTYAPTDYDSAAIGGGFGGVGMLLDEGGSDWHEARRWMGAGAAGAGILISLGDEGDVYYPALDNTRITKYALGAGGLGGKGFFYDEGGDDYLVKAGVDGLGWGGVGGQGILLNHGGNDVYRVILGDAGQDGMITGPTGGAGEIGGLGILFDDTGNDWYACDDKVNYACFGGAIVGSFGLLLEGDGNDQYTLNTSYDWAPKQIHSPGAGGGATLSVGILLDRLGNDQYRLYDRAGGYGTCFGVGLLLDTNGTDLYRSTLNSTYGYGNATECPYVNLVLGLLVEDQPDAPGVGLFVDSSANDDYGTPFTPQHGSRGNNHFWVDGSTGTQSAGVGIDYGLV